MKKDKKTKNNISGNKTDLDHIHKYIHDYLKKNWVHLMMPPLAIGQLGGVLEQNGFPVSLKDDLVQSEDEIKSAITESDVVGISAMTPNAERAIYWAKYAKEMGKVVVAGGVHATIFPEFFLNSGFVDFVVRGEGEFTLVKLLQSLQQGQNVHDIPGLGFLENEQVILTPPHELIQDLDALPFSSFDMLPVDRYYRNSPQNQKYYPVFSSRGCPFDCAYCTKQMSPRKYRMRSAHHVVDEIEQAVKNYHIKRVIFCDDHFTLNRKRTIDICQEIIRRDLKLLWVCLTRVDAVDEELLRVMRDSGCYKIEYGVESGSPKILKKMNKKFTVEQVVQATKLSTSIGIRAKFYIMIGFPSETHEDIELTKKLLKKAQPPNLGVVIFNPLPGTKIYEQIKNSVNVQAFSGINYVQGDPVFDHENFTHEQLKKMRNEIEEEYMNFYYSPLQRIKRIFRRVFWLVSHYQDFKWRVKIALG